LQAHADAVPAAAEAASEVIAAVDLGSNSFHMIVGELRHGQLLIIDRIRETVRLSEGLKDNGPLGLAARARALDCLSRFGERLRDMHASSVRTAGTSALRRASDSQDFLVDAEKALGHPIEVISGIEEARLIYVGVSHSLPPNTGLRLVLDIGGGSTELILGEGIHTKALQSLQMGCVNVTEKYFPDGAINAENFAAARVAARLKLRPVKAHFRGIPDVEAIGTSGTILATEVAARELDVIESGELTPAAVEALIDRVLQFGNIADLSFPGLTERRVQVWPGGLAILVELLEVLRIEKLRVSDGALREGLLYDLLGRLQHQDARARSVQAMAIRYSVDQQQAERVAAVAQALLRQVASSWDLGSALAANTIDWAARLHEIGLDISHDNFQKHGAYVAQNADLPGFPRAEQKLLAFLIATQRKQIDMALVKELPISWRDKAMKLSLLHRLAVLLNRSRSNSEFVPIAAAAAGSLLSLLFPDGWLAKNPLTVTDLDRERAYLKEVGFDLTYA
jgi:exopolyphosphatase/guanosine-5'-triphosphate,3'-diphosphate pyrophosphatase